MEALDINTLEIEQIRSLIYKETGMLFSENKNYFLASRLRQRMSVRGIEKFSEYYHELLFNTASQELKEFIEAVTINETYFFRDFPQLQGFAELVLPPYVEKKEKNKDSNFRIWSAACSTGEEAYTLSIIMQEMLPTGSWKVQIDATDIDTKVLATAKNGIYGDRSVKDVPTVYKQKYFQSQGDRHAVHQQLKDLIQFRQLNFVDRPAMRAMRGYDFIFCRNVLIYFDDESRKKVVNSLYDSLVPGGYLFLGHSESVGRMTAAFHLEKFGDFLTYRKPA